MKKVSVWTVLLVFVALGNVSAKKPPKNATEQPEFYYNEGCKALRKRKFELAKENF